MDRIARLLPIAVLIAACTATSPGASPSTTAASKVGGSVTFAAQSDPDTLDPHKTSNPVSSVVFTWIYEPLVYQDLDNSYKGLLAQSWTVSDDNKTITFKLRSGIKFTDGSPFNAAAVKFTFERLQKEGTKSPIQPTFKNVVSMSAPDDTTFVMQLKEPSAPIFHDLQQSYAGILSPSAVQKANDDIGRTAVGTGPYTLGEWKTGQQITLVRNADYHGAPESFANRGAPYIQQIVYKVIPDPASQLAALQAGEVDYLGLTATQLPSVANDPKFKIYDSYAYGLTYLGFDAKRPPFDNAQLRRALSHAVDKNEIVQAVFDNKLAKAQCCPIAESIPGYDPKLAQYDAAYDPGKAKSDLDALGYKLGAGGMRTTPDGKPFQPVLWTTTEATLGKVATLLQAQFKAVGVDLQIHQVESGALLAATPNAVHDLYLNGYSWNEPDMYSLFLSCDRLKSSNRVLYCDPTLEKLIQEGRTTLDQTKRMQIYFDAQKYTLEQAPWQPLYMPVNKTAVRASVKDLKQGKSGALYWYDAYVTK